MGLRVGERCKEHQAHKEHLIHQPTGHTASSCWLAPRHVVSHVGHTQAGISTNTDWYIGHMEVDKHTYRKTHRLAKTEGKSLGL